MAHSKFFKVEVDFKDIFGKVTITTKATNDNKQAGAITAAAVSGLGTFAPNMSQIVAVRAYSFGKLVKEINTR